MDLENLKNIEKIAKEFQASLDKALKQGNSMFGDLDEESKKKVAEINTDIQNAMQHVRKAGDTDELTKLYQKYANNSH